MKKRFITLSLALLSFGVMNYFYGQEKTEIVNWYNGKSPGMNTDKAYSSLKKRKSSTVIVAVIDSGIDIEHKDLQGKIWLNEDEIPNNGIDDDKNGYIDDMHGWNFLGSATGENQKYARLEKTRLLAQLEERFKGKESSQVASADKADYELYKRLNKEVADERKGNMEALEQYKALGEMLPGIKAKLIEKLGADFTVEDVENWKPSSPEEMQMKQLGAYIASGGCRSF